MATTRKAAALAVKHLPTCAAARIERYGAQRPDGSAVVVTRCQECGAHEVRPNGPAGSSKS